MKPFLYNGFPLSWKLHAGIFVTFYAFYAYQWINYYFLYQGKAGWHGFELFLATLFTAPFYGAYNLYCLYIAIKTQNKPLLIIVTSSLLILAIHLIAVFN